MANEQNNSPIPYLTEMVNIQQLLGEDGYILDFRVTEDGLTAEGLAKTYSPSEVTVTNYYRFEGVSNPDDSAILYAIETADGTRGTLTDAYGAYSNPLIDAFIKKVDHINKRPHEHRDPS